MWTRDADLSVFSILAPVAPPFSPLSLRSGKGLGATAWAKCLFRHLEVVRLGYRVAVAHPLANHVGGDDVNVRPGFLRHELSRDFHHNFPDKNLDAPCDSCSLTDANLDRLDTVSVVPWFLTSRNRG
jgi:hypothetical protein